MQLERTGLPITRVRGRADLLETLSSSLDRCAETWREVIVINHDRRELSCRETLSRITQLLALRLRIYKGIVLAFESRTSFRTIYIIYTTNTSSLYTAFLADKLITTQQTLEPLMHFHMPIGQWGRLLRRTGIMRLKILVRCCRSTATNPSSAESEGKVAWIFNSRVHHVSTDSRIYLLQFLHNCKQKPPQHVTLQT